MRLDPKYFNHFMVIVAVLAVIAIVVSTLTHRESQEQEFKKRISQSDSLSLKYLPKLFEDDSLRIQDLRGRFVILDFWASWSDLSARSHRHLAELGRNRDSLKIIAAAVKDVVSDVEAYEEAHSHPFIYVDGTQIYNHFNVPGLPSQVLFGPVGEVRGIFIGYHDSTRYDTLKSLLRNE